ncbi:hypothetical protein FDUTEX481_00405 [Tolypothrix sp. PCC 7601]|nr:hypothetical protein FDUTEX481_00405 [Tolypothrix sp. PCC 7601]
MARGFFLVIVGKKYTNICGLRGKRGRGKGNKTFNLSIGKIMR